MWIFATSYIVWKGNLNIYPRVNEEKDVKIVRSQSWKHFLSGWRNLLFTEIAESEKQLKLADGLRAFLNDGRIEMDNNPTENAICLSMAEDRKRKWCG